MNKKEELRLQEIESAAKAGQLKSYISKLTPQETTICINILQKWQEESEARHNKAWHKASNELSRKAVEKTEIQEIQIIADLLYLFLKKKFLEKIERRQRMRRQY
jgi:hypothetical protein